ncbi:ATP-grasp domain-containing protein [Streptomyces sp. NPDC038707]|uniref:Aspartic acid-holo carrier protein ligase n=1 Tax=Streptomyces achromogenes subsp. streptozoticus TaxID=285532 RepID=A0A898JTG5_STRC2|nr:aspartic acid-holo carrier protein ligase [Streptomyces achromogenes subsp. streptozoticus]
MSFDDGYTAGLKQALTGDRDARFVWLCNFEVENQWARSYTGLPAARGSATAATVQRMEELGALLAEPADYLLLDRPLDEGYRSYAEKTGLGAPVELVTAAPAADGGTGAAVLDSPELLERLRRIARDGAYLMPMGNSVQEERIAELTGLRLAVPDAATCERVNSKIYSRRAAEELGLRTIPGFCCETVGQLRRALDEGLRDDRPVIVKDAYGVSGKGLLILDSRRKADRLLRMVERRAANRGDDALHVVVETFLPKRFDLNYQFTVDRRGRVRLDFVKQALTSGGVHLGHVMPADLTPAQQDELAAAAVALGARLYADGFFGVVGVDALLGADDRVYPVLEINARLNMSSYQGRVTERFGRPRGAALARHYPLRLAEPLPFEAVTDALGDLAEPPHDRDGLVITCFGTVNAQAGDALAGVPRGTPAPHFNGRLYTMLFAGNREGLDVLDRRVEAALDRLNTAGRTP